MTITSVQLFWSDGTVTTSRRELLAATVVGVQVAYDVVTPPSAGSTSSLEALLANPTTVSAVSANLANSIPDAVVKPPLVLTPTSAPTFLPTFTPSSSPIVETAPVLTPVTSPVTSPVVSSPFASPVATPVTTPTVPTTTTSTTVSATQSVSSAALTVTQAQSGSFTSAFVAGIQNAVPGVTVTVTSVAAARRRLLASVVVSYTAVSTSTDTATLTAGLSSSATVTAISTSLSNAGYPGVSVSSPVIGPGAPTTTSSSSSGGGTSGSSSGSGGGGNIPVIAGSVVGGLVLIAVAVLVPVLVMRNKKPASNRFELTPEVNGDPNELVSMEQQQPQLLHHHLEASTMDAGGQACIEEEPPAYPLHHVDPRSRSVSHSEKSVSSMDNESVREGSQQGPSIGAAAFHRSHSLMKAGIHVQSNTDEEPEQRQAADVNNNNNNNTPITPLSPPPPRAWSHAVSRMSQLRPKSVTINEPSQPSAVMTTQLVTGIEDDSDNFRASFVAAVASAINAPNSVVEVVLVTKVDAGLSVVYKIASHASDAQSIEQTLSSGVAAMSEELQKTFPGTAVAAPKVVPVSSPNKPLPQPRAPAIKQSRFLPSQPPQPKVVEVSLSIVGVTNPSSSNFRALMIDSLAHLLPPETTAEIVSVSSVKGRTSVVCKITTTSATAGNADNIVASLQSSKNMMTLMKDLRATFPTAIIAPPSVTVLPSPSAAEDEEEMGQSSSFGMGDLYRERRPHEIAHRRPVHVESASTFHRPRQVPSHLPIPPRLVLPEETLWVPPSWTAPDGNDIRISDEEMHMMDVNAARKQAARRHSVTSVDSQYTDVWKHTRQDDVASEDDGSIVSMVQCEEYEDKAHAMLMEKLYAQDDEFNAVMTEIMRAEVTDPLPLFISTLEYSRISILILHCPLRIYPY